MIDQSPLKPALIHIFGIFWKCSQHLSGLGKKNYNLIKMPIVV